MHYEVVGVLGRGAMAVVELAVAPDGTHVARKRLPLGGSAYEMDLARRRLRREAEILASLHHPAIVPVLEVEDDGTDVVIVMPALVGSLADRVASRGPLPPAEVVEVGRRLLEGLAAAHRSGIVHRDIKPGNVLFDDADNAALADFGVAVSRDLTAGLTVAGTVVGTPTWMAPEQASGDGAGTASDVFSLGATLRFALTGEGPWGRGPAEAVLARAARGDVVPLPATIPASVRAPLAAMLDPRPHRRPSAAAVLGGFDGTAVRAVPPASPGSPGSLTGVVPGSVPGSSAALRGRSPGRRRRDLHRPLDSRAGPQRLGAPGVGRLLAGMARVVVGGDGPPPRSRRRLALTAAMGAVVLAVVGGLVAVALSAPGRPARAGAAGASPPGPLPTACVPRPYQPCGAPVGAHTDGTSCLPGWYDLDGNTANGCEARSDYTDGRVLTAAAPLLANLVPATSVDTFTTRVTGHALSLCSGTLRLTLVAPAGTADRLEVRHGSTLLASATSVNGQPATATVDKPSCFGSDSETLTLGVRAVVGVSAADFTLQRSGGW